MSERAEVAIVSGGSRGLGACIVKGLLDRGYRVACFSRQRSTFVDDLTSADPQHERFYWQALDARDTQGLRDFVRAVSRRWGPTGVLVNNAGTGQDGLLALTSEAQISSTIAINLESVIHLTRSCLKTMMAAGRGTIVNISSINAVRGHRGVAVYSATKAALDGLTRSLAREVGPAGIRVNSVAPGFFESAMTEQLSPDVRQKLVGRIPLQRLGTDADVTRVVLFLISDDAAYVHGQTLVVDGGLSC